MMKVVAGADDTAIVKPALDKQENPSSPAQHNGLDCTFRSHCVSNTFMKEQTKIHTSSRQIVCSTQIPR